MIRFATIGTNFIVPRFLKEANKCKELKYVAAYSRNYQRAEEFASKYGAERGCSDLMQLADSKDIDAVYVASPNALHFSQAVTLMKAKKHILCEKTVASNSKELKIMTDAAVANQVVFLEAMRIAYDPAMNVIEGSLFKLGKIRSVTFQYCQYSSRYDNYKRGIIENAFKPELSNGALMDIGVYCVYPLIRMFQLPDSIQASSIFLENGVDGAGTVLAYYNKGMQARLVYSKITDSYLPSEIQGELGCLIIDKIPNPSNIMIHYRDGSKEEVLCRDSDSNMIYEVQQWIHLINTHSFNHKYSEAMVQELFFLDEVRKKCGIVFPAD